MNSWSKRRLDTVRAAGVPELYRRERAGFEKKFRWHDWRHTWASWHAQDGTPQSVLQTLGGWSSSEMVRRYAHLTAEHLAPYVENAAINRTVTGAVDSEVEEAAEAAA